MTHLLASELLAKLNGVLNCLMHKHDLPRASQEVQDCRIRNCPVGTTVRCCCCWMCLFCFCLSPA